MISCSLGELAAAWVQQKAKTRNVSFACSVIRGSTLAGTKLKNIIRGLLEEKPCIFTIQDARSVSCQSLSLEQYV